VSKKLSARKNIIISTGGGMVINKICIDYLRKRGVVIYLKASFEEIVKRLKGDKSRPLFHDQLIAKKLFQFRHALYKEYADKEINTDGKSVEEVISSLLKIIRSQLG